jgi:nicotinate phosphoribosyltransferase
MIGDELGLDGETREGEALMRPVMKAGKRVSPPVALRELRRRTLSELNRLPVQLRGLRQTGEYKVMVSAAIHELARQVDAAQQKTADGDN